MTRYIRRPLTSEDRNVHRILSEEPIQRLIAEGCFVAGGAMLMATWGSWKLGQSLFLDDYLKTNDIDVFATSEEAHKRAMVVVGMQGFTSSVMGTAVNTKSRPGDFKIQLVTARFAGPVEEALEMFDIANCKVATDGKDLIYHEEVPELERSRTLLLHKSPGFMLAWRIVKYMNRGYHSLHPDSREFIIEWFIRLKTQEWDLRDASRRYFYNHNQIRAFLGDKRLVHDEDLLLAIGFMQMVVEVIKGSGSYDANQELVKDLAREELERRLGAPLKMKDSNHL